MTREELQRRLADHEDNFVERKPDGVAGSEQRRTLVAFANSVPDGREAVLFIGVRDGGSIQGCKNSDSIQKTVRRIAEQECYPPIAITCEVITTGQGPVVAVVVVAASTRRPHFAGPAFVRRGSESVAASEEVFTELVHSRNSTVAAVLKLKNQVIDVVSIQHKLGEARRIADQGHREGGEIRVLECTPQTVRFQLIASGRYVTEPLDHVQVSYNEEKYRPMLIVTGY
jgi:predicted HTH transcriptional regulator